MASALNKPKLDNLTNEIWKSAERLRGKFKAYEYQSVILPIIVIRRLECVLIAWREQKRAEIAEKRPDLSDAKLDDMVKKLERQPQQAPFSNTTSWTLHSLFEEDPTQLETNFRDYLNGFSANVQEVIEHFNYRNVVTLMVKNNRLGPIINQYRNLPLGPAQLTNLEMGYVYEELLRRFSEQSGEEAGEHFTPREVIRLMVELLEIPVPTRHLSLYDPACGTGGMLSVAKEHLLEKADQGAQDAVEKLITLHGQELSPSNYAICRADLLIKQDTQARVHLGNSLIPHVKGAREPGDQLAGRDDHFDFMLSNPPFGVTWGGKDGYEDEARKLAATRYKAGMPRSNDGALLFLQTMLAKMKPAEQGGSRMAIIFNGSSLSNGDCGSGESEIRRWILENDWLDAIVMLPDQLFYNTGISTYIWLLRNEKPKSHQGRVMLIDARKQFEKEPKAFGNKRNRLTDGHRDWIETRYKNGWADGFKDADVQLFRTTDFAFHKVSVVFWQFDEHDQPATLTEPYEKAFTAANIAKEQAFYASELKFSVSAELPVAAGKAKSAKASTGREIKFTLQPDDSFSKVWSAAVLKAFAPEITALTQGIEEARARNAAIKRFIESLRLSVCWTHRHYVQDDEYIPFDIDGDPAAYIPAFLDREIAKPIIRWADAPQLGYEILPNKFFYRYQEPKAASELLKEFWLLEENAEKMLEKLEKGAR
ncbi:MAG: adenine-specific methylase [Proteobacteria bacterium]|nr:adenine-specific methylase [Pseudomonadota bacterium]